MDEELSGRLARSGYDREGFAADYDRYRPRPPSVLLELLPRLARITRPKLVVDLGAGTGLSTRFWADAADEVVGVEPNQAMRAFADQATEAPNVRYVGTSSYDTGLASASANLVTAAQSLQWMRPDDLFPEIARLLTEGGVFCAYNYTAFVTPVWEAAAAFDVVLERKRELRTRLGLDPPASAQPSLAWLEESGAFREVREMFMHSTEEGNGDRLIGFTLSEGSMRTLLEAGASEADVGLDRLRDAAAAMPETVPWWIGYRAWIGLK
jgi:SAM-dependent methyltransferase